MRRNTDGQSTAGGGQNSHSEEQSMFSPGAEKKQLAQPDPESSVGFGGWMSQATNFLENVGEVVSHATNEIGDMIAPIDEDDMSLDDSRDGSTAGTPIARNYTQTASSTELQRQYSKHNFGDSVDDTPTYTPTTISDNTSATSSVASKVPLGPGAGTGSNSSTAQQSLSLSAPRYDPKFTSSPTPPSVIPAMAPSFQEAPVKIELSEVIQEGEGKGEQEEASLADISLCSPPSRAGVLPTTQATATTITPALASGHVEDVVVIPATSSGQGSGSATSEGGGSVASEGIKGPPTTTFFYNGTELETAAQQRYRASIEEQCDVFQKRALSAEEEVQKLRKLQDKDNNSRSNRMIAGNDEVQSALTAASKEIARLSDALQQSEDSVVQHEEFLWQTKAQAAELQYALEQERSEMAATLHEKNMLMEKIVQVEEASAAAAATATAMTASASGEQEEISVQKAEIEGLTEVVQTLQDALRSIQQENDGLARDLHNARETASAVTAASTTPNSTDVDQSSSAMYTAQIEELQQELRTSQNEVLSWKEDTATAQGQVLLAQADVSTAQGEIQILRDELNIERNERDDASASLTSELKQARADSTKLDHERSQLQLVIQQLRTHKRSERDEIDSVAQERDALKAKVESLTAGWDADSRALAQLQQKHEDTSYSSDDLQRQLQECLSREKSLVGSYNNLQVELQDYEKRNYDLTRLFDSNQADLLLCNQENKRTLQEVTNLKLALADSESEARSVSNDTDKKIQQSIHIYSTQRDAEAQEKEKTWKETTYVLQQELSSVKQRVEDECLLRRKATLDLNQEKQKMQKTLENALSQLRTQTDDVVDRQLIANLLASYFQKGGNSSKNDVLTLISKVLSFTDEQLVIVGLKAPPTHFISSIFETITGSSSSNSAGGGNGDAGNTGSSLAEAWVTFLEQEAASVSADTADTVADSTPGKSGRPKPSICVATD